MSDVSLTHTIDPPSVSTTEVQENFEDLRDGINNQFPVVEADIQSTNNPVFKTLLVANSVTQQSLAAGTYALGFGSQIDDPSPVSLGAEQIAVIYLDDADYAVSSLTAKLRVRAQVSTNGTVPAITFTFGLRPVTFSGAGDVLNATLGAVVASSTVAIASPPANTVTGGVSSEFNVPADGIYALGVLTSATLTNNATCLLSAQLQTRNT